MLFQRLKSLIALIQRVPKKEYWFNLLKAKGDDQIRDSIARRWIVDRTRGSERPFLPSQAIKKTETELYLQIYRNYVSLTRQTR